MGTRYRVITVPSGKAHSKWRASRADAEQDAINLGMAERDDDEPGTVYLDPLVEIEEEPERASKDAPASRTLTDWELWACANETLCQHGLDAAIFAAMRADALDEAGDIDGGKAWREIIRRIERLIENPEVLH